MNKEDKKTNKTFSKQILVVNNFTLLNVKSTIQDKENYLINKAKKIKKKKETSKNLLSKKILFLLLITV